MKPFELKVRLAERLVTPWTAGFWHLEKGHDQGRQVFGFAGCPRARN